LIIIAFVAFVSLASAADKTADAKGVKLYDFPPVTDKGEMKKLDALSPEHGPPTSSRPCRMRTPEGQRIARRLQGEVALLWKDGWS